MELRRNFRRSKIWFYMLGVLTVILVVLLVQTAFADGTARGKANKGDKTQEEGLLVNEYPKVNALAEKYFAAVMNGNIDTLKEIVIPFSESDQAAATRISEFVESYDDLNCYTEDGVDENTYIAFVSYQLKFPEVDTPAPALETWIISTDESGSLYINRDMSTLSDDMKTQLEELLVREDVKKLFSDVDAKMLEALNADESLKSLYQQMGGNPEDVAQEEEDKDKDKEEKEEPKVTEAPVGKVEREMVAAVELEIYEKPSEDDNPLGKLSVGSFVWVDKNVEGGYSYVDKDGVTGYVHTSGLVTYKAVDEEIKATVNYYSSCDPDAPVMGTITSDKSYYCSLEFSNGWRQIIVNDTKVYVKVSDLGLEEEAATEKPKEKETEKPKDEEKETEKPKDEKKETEKPKED